MNFDNDDFEGEVEKQSWLDDFLVDIESLAHHYIKMYFQEEDIPKNVKEKYISCILNTNIMRGVRLIYKALEKKRKKEKKDKDDIHDIKYVLSLLQDCAKKGIPKCFACGILIMKLELKDKVYVLT